MTFGLALILVGVSGIVGAVAGVIYNRRKRKGEQ